MSKFIDKLNRLIRGEPMSIGFVARQPASTKPKIQLVASITQEYTEILANRVAGADAGIIRILEPGKGAEALQKIAQIIPDIPWGGWLQNGDQETIEQMTKAGCDFITFPAANTPLAIVENTGVGKILEIESSINEGLLRATNELPVDAVLVGSDQREGCILTWQDLMFFQHFSRLLTKPLLVCVAAKVTGSELKALWEAGVSGVVLEAGPEETQDKIKKLRQIIDNLEFPVTRRREKIQPRLSYSSREQGTVTTEEEEEEE